MHCLIVLAHPEEQSFNAQLAGTAKARFEAQGHTVEIIDLYRDGFDPCEHIRHFPDPSCPDYFSAMAEQRHASDTNTLPADVEHTIEQLERADLILLQFPLWWWSAPAILKGWLDRVFVWGRVYSSKVRYHDRGHFRGKRALVSTTTGAPAAAFGPDGRCGDLDLVLWHIHFSLSYVGFSVLPQFHCGNVGKSPGSDPAVLHQRLARYKAELGAYIDRLDELEPLKFNGFEDWDESGRLKPGAMSHSPFIRHVRRADHQHKTEHTRRRSSDTSA